MSDTDSKLNNKLALAIPFVTTFGAVATPFFVLVMMYLKPTLINIKLDASIITAITVVVNAVFLFGSWFWTKQVFKLLDKKIENRLYFWIAIYITPIIVFSIVSLMVVAMSVSSVLKTTP